MAAGQQKKRLHASNVVSCNLEEQYGIKKKKDMISSHIFLNMKAHISLEWDEIEQKVVARKEQVGITWRKLGPFVNTLVPRHNALADVFSIPQQVFGLEDLSGVLSYEVWKMQLSETEKIFLTQFLPKGADAEEVVQSLLKGENFHFGNPFLKWGVSLCSGKLHPDAILNQEQCLAAYKKAYDLELQKYHNDYLNHNIVEELQKLKETWMGRDGPEQDIIEKMWRNEYVGESRTITAALPKVVASSRKEEKPQKLYIRSGDGAKYMSYFKVTKQQHQLVQKIKQPDGIKPRCLNHVLGDIRSFQVQPYEVYEEEERKKLHEHWLRLANRDLPAAFTTWTERLLQRQNWRRTLGQEIKESKTVVSEDEKSDDSSLFQELDIGEADEAFMDEDDDESAPQFTAVRPLQRIPSLNGDHRLEPMIAEFEEENSEDDDESAHHFTAARPLQKIPSLNGDHRLEPMIAEFEEGSKDIFESQCVSPVLSKLVGDAYSRDAFQGIPSLDSCYDIEPMKSQSDESSLEIFKPELASPVLPKFLGDKNPAEFFEQKEIPCSAEGLVSYPTDSQPLQQITSVNRNHRPDSLDIKFKESIQEVTKPNNSMPVMSQFTGDINMIDDGIDHQVCSPSASDPWLEVGLPYSNHHAHVNHGYPSSSKLSLGQPNLNDNLRSGFHLGTGGSFASSYSNQDQDKLFHPFLKKHELVPSQINNQKQGRLQFMGSHTVLPKSGSLPGHLQEQQQQLLEQRQHMRERDCYMHQARHKNIYSYSGGRHPLPGQELFSEVNMQNWGVDPIQVSTPLQSLSAGHESSSHVQHRGCSGWAGMDVSSSSECLGNGNNVDGSLYSVLSEFHKAHYPSYNIMSTSEQGEARNDGLGGNGNVYPHTSHQFNYPSGTEVATATLTASNVSWTNLPHQSSGLHDSIGKTFLRSWNL